MTMHESVGHSAREADEDELAIEVTFELEEEHSGIQARPLPPPRTEPVSYVHGAPVVLVIDDDASMQRRVTAALASRYTVYVASDGADGLAVLARIPRPDCVVCDINMPRMGGIELARIVKVMAPMKGVPIAFLSSSADPRTVCDAINAGARHFISKKDKPENILAKIESILSRVAPVQGGRPAVPAPPASTVMRRAARA